MKTLVIGDIHGNLLALEKVLTTHRNEVDQIICHGDVVNYGPWSNECVELLADTGCNCLRGNHEDAFVNGYYPGNNQLVKLFFAQTYRDFKYLNTLNKFGTSAKIGNYEIMHTINNTYYYPDSNFSAVNLFENTIIGHSHYSFHKILNNGKTLTNTGSVGQNRKNLSIIEYVILEDEDVKLMSMKYNPLALIKEMESQKYPIQCIDYYKSKL